MLLPAVTEFSADAAAERYADCARAMGVAGAADPTSAAIKKLVEPVAALNLARLQNHLKTAKREAQHTLNPKLFLESLLFSYRQLMLG